MARKKRSVVSNLGNYAKKRNTSLQPEAKNPQCETPSHEIISPNVRNCRRNHRSVARELRLLRVGVSGVERQITSDTNLCVGHRIIPVKSLKDNIEGNLCCKLCTTEDLDNMLLKFAEFCDKQPNVTGIRGLLEKFQSSPIFLNVELVISL